MLGAAMHQTESIITSFNCITIVLLPTTLFCGIFFICLSALRPDIVLRCCVVIARSWYGATGATLAFDVIRRRSVLTNHSTDTGKTVTHNFTIHAPERPTPLVDFYPL